MAYKKIKDLEELAARWPSGLVARTEIHKFTGGLLSGRTLANYDSRGEGPPRVRLGRKVAYPTDELVRWLAARLEKAA